MRAAVGVLRVFAGAATSIAAAALEIVLLPIDAGRGRIFHAVARGWARAILKLSGIRVNVRGLNLLDPSRNYVFVSNHASLFDIPCVLAGLPGQVRIIYKKELEVIPIFGWGLKWGAYIAIERGRSARAVRSLEVAVRKIRRGASVLLYAEGTRTRTGKLQPFKRGAFNLALRAGVPVVPLTINGTYPILRRRSLVVHPRRVELILDQPIEVNGNQGKDAELNLMERVHSAIARHYVDQE
jgi:1-acyl-sn-glycerol-3-phosphate acyltransferase